jgi:hypothetical protein
MQITSPVSSSLSFATLQANDVVTSEEARTARALTLMMVLYVEKDRHFANGH